MYLAGLSLLPLLSSSHSHQPWHLGQPGKRLCCRLREMLGRLSLAVHRLLSPFCSIFPINKVPGETLARWVLGLSCRKLPPFSISFFLSTWSHLQLLILSLLLLSLPSQASSLSSVSSLPFGLFLLCGSALPLPQPATSSLPLQTFFCFSPPIFLLPFSSMVPQKQTHRETTYCS